MQIQKRMEEMAAAGLDTCQLDDEAFNLEAAQDRCILRLIASCCNGELLLRKKNCFVTSLSALHNIDLTTTIKAFIHCCWVCYMNY